MFLNPTLTPKIAPKDQKIARKGPKKCKRGPKCGQIKQKDRAVLPKPKLIVYIGRSQKCFWTWKQPKKLPWRTQKVQNSPNFGRIKNQTISATAEMSHRPHKVLPCEFLLHYFRFKVLFIQILFNILHLLPQLSYLHLHKAQTLMLALWNLVVIMFHYITWLGCFYVTVILSPGWVWGWFEVEIVAEVDLRLTLKCGWVKVEVEI